MAPSKTTILVVEDNMLTRVGVASLLAGNDDFVVVAQAPDGEAGIELYRKHRPAVVVTDLRMPGTDGVKLVEVLAAETPPARVLLLTHYDGEENIFRAVRAGALGYLTKDAEASVIFEAVRAVARGERYLPAAIAAKLVTRSMGKGLSPREQQVLELLQKGMANKEIAGKLGLMDKTVQLYVAAILEKLGVHSRSEAVAVALQRGLLLPHV